MIGQFLWRLGGVEALLEKFRRDEKGAVMMVAGLAMIPLFLALGAANDYATASRLRSRMQAAADAAALRAAYAATQTQSARQSVASSVVTANLPELTQAYQLTVNEYDKGSGLFQVIATAQMPTAVMRLGGVAYVNLSVQSTALATTVTTSSSGATGNFCILAVSTNQTGITFNSGVTINAPNCNIDIASTANGAATFNSGDSFHVAKICVAGTNVTNNDGTLAVLSKGCSVPADPFGGSVLPTVSVPSTPGGCSSANVNLSSGKISTVTAVYGSNSSTPFYCGANFNVNGATNATVQLQPGVYTGSWNFNSGNGTTVVFEPGLYIFENVTWNMNSGWIMDGTQGVTFYYADTSYLQINSGVTVNLNAPSTGTYANILMFENSGLSQSSFAYDGGSYSSGGCEGFTTGGYNLNGLVHLPSRNITFNSNVNVTSQALYLVVNTAIYDNVTWNLSSSSITLGGGGGTSTSVTNVSLYQ